MRVTLSLSKCLPTSEVTVVRARQVLSDKDSPELTQVYTTRYKTEGQMDRSC